MGNLKKFSLLFLLLISASFVTPSFAGRPSMLAKEVEAAYDQEILSSKGSKVEKEEGASIHERLLKVNTKDYGRYDPAPALVRPPFKLIPN